jgi:hypothetical protein
MKMLAIALAGITAACASTTEQPGNIDLIVIPKSQVPPSSMETAQGTVSMGPGGCVTLDDGATRTLLVFPEPSSMSFQDGRKTISSVSSRMIDGATYIVTGSTMGAPDSQFQSRFGLNSDCGADQVFLFNGTIDSDRR